MNKIKNLKIFFIILISILMFLPLLFLNREENYISEIDNKKLENFPEINSLSNIKKINNYIDDRIGGRELAIETYTALMNCAFNILVHPTYTYGQKGHVFFSMRDEINYSEYHDLFVSSIVEIRNYVESRGGKFYMMINPEKTSVYTEYLPSGVNYNRTWIEQLESKLKLNGINYIDNTELLKEKSKTEYVYDKMYDSGHWNDLGAFYGVNNLLSNINNDFPNVKTLELSDFDISKEIQTTLKVSRFNIYDESPVFTLKNEENYADITDIYFGLDISLNFPTYSVTVNNSKQSENLPKALVFQGSYLNGREKYLKSRFSQYTAIHNYQNIFNVDYYYDIFEPDIVIFEVAEYTIQDNYFAEEYMKNLELT